MAKLTTDEIIDALKEMTLLEASELVKAIEDTFGVSAAAPVAVAAAPAAPAAAPVADGTKVTAPMPGTILDIKVAVGDTVKSGQAICVLEAMKMENDVNAPCDGKVLSINTTKGSAVETGAVLAVIG